MSNQTRKAQQHTVTLEDGFERDGTTVREITVRRPTWKDIKKANQAAAGESDQTLRDMLVTESLLQRCADMAPEEIDALVQEDIETIGEALGGFSQTPTPTSSGR